MGAFCPQPGSTRAAPPPPWSPKPSRVCAALKTKLAALRLILNFVICVRMLAGAPKWYKKCQGRGVSSSSFPLTLWSTTTTTTTATTTTKTTTTTSTTTTTTSTTRNRTTTTTTTTT